MKSHQDIEVAVLLATHNGQRFVEQQVLSLSENVNSFTVHWLDDDSTDDTRRIVRAVAHDSGIRLREWHQPVRQGIPGAFFQLLESVEADLYLFCDQDDIWQQHKIDVTVAELAPRLKTAALCTSDPLMFKTEEPDRFYRLSQVVGSKIDLALQDSRLFMPTIAQGHTQGFTRPIRQLYIAHKDIARAYALMHDMWLYAIAVASGTIHWISDAPTTLYRWHKRNASDKYNSWTGQGIGRLTLTWEQQQRLRRALARQATGFILASPTLPPSLKLARLLDVARLVATLDRRQSPQAILDLIRRDALWPSKRLAAGLVTACLISDARE